MKTEKKDLHEKYRLLFGVVIYILVLFPTLELSQSKWCKNWNNSWLDHRVAGWGNKKLILPGVNARRMDSTLKKNFAFPKFLAELGFSLRAFFHEVQDWLLIENHQLLLREEILSDYKSPELDRLRTKNETNLLAFYSQLAKIHQFETVMLIIPTKLFANRIHINYSKLLVNQQTTFSIASPSVWVGSEENQKDSERRLQKKGVQLISILDAIKKIEDTDPYPPSDTHWSKGTIFKLAPVIADQLVEQFQLPRTCLAVGKSQSRPKVLDSGFLGDLYSYLQAGQLLKYQFQSVESDYGNRDGNALGHLDSCPTLFLMGTSYSDTYRGKGDLAQVLEYFYLGKVINYSVTGGGLKGAFKHIPSEPGSHLIWEFPFRFLSRDWNEKTDHS